MVSRPRGCVVAVVAVAATVVALGLPGTWEVEPVLARSAQDVPGVGDPRGEVEGPASTGPGDSAPDLASDGVRRTGPDPSGQAVPDTGQRVLDSAIWLWLLACLVAAGVGVAWVWRSAGAERPLLDEDGEPDEPDERG